MAREKKKSKDIIEKSENTAENIRPLTSRAQRAEGLHSHEKAGGRPSKSWGIDKFFWCILILAVVLSGHDLYRRLSVEWRHRTVGIAVEYRDLVLLSRQSGESPEAIFNRMKALGAEGITVSDLMGKDLAAGFLPVYYGSLATFRPILSMSLSLPLDRAALLIENSEPLLQPILDYLRTRNTGIATLATGEGTLVVLPQATDELADAGVLPDFTALEFAARMRAVSVFRPVASPGVDAEQTAEGLRWLKEKYPSITCILPAGQTVIGYPSLAAIVRTLKEHDITAGQAEFVRQVGISEFNAAMNPSLLPLHSLVREETLSRRYSRSQIIERMVRAVHERSIRILLLRPYELYSIDRLEPFIEDMAEIQSALTSRSYSLGWPETIPMFRASAASAIALALVFSLCFWSYARRYLVPDTKISRFELAAVVICSILIGLGAWKISAVSKLLGGLAAAFLATEATLWALDRYDRPFYGLLAGLLIVLSGGLCIAAFYGTTNAMLRITPFSGVRMTLLLPPVLILASDLKNRIHPESFMDIVRRPSLWGELMLLGFILVCTAILTIRSDNVSFVPGWEVQFRDMLERLLWVRPRTKEFLVGYPCLIVYYVIRRRNLFVNYREVFRIGASMAFASAVNSFCHFHTLLPLTAVRVANGWILGIVVGIAALVFIDYIGRPVWRAVVVLFD